MWTARRPLLALGRPIANLHLASESPLLHQSQQRVLPLVPPHEVGEQPQQGTGAAEEHIFS